MLARKPKILLGVTGGIAAYKSAEIVRRLQQEQCDVRVVMTENATKFVQPLTFQSLTGHQVAVGMFDNPHDPIPHISLGQSCDLFLIAPCTANTAAKIAHGIADDLMSSTALACKAPLVLAPAMNVVMYQNPATQANLETLRSHGVYIIEAASGYLACGEVGEGRLPDIDYIVAYALQILEEGTENPDATAGDEDDADEDDEDDTGEKGRDVDIGFDDIFELADRIEAGIVDPDDITEDLDAAAHDDESERSVEREHEDSESVEAVCESDDAERSAFEKQDTQPMNVIAIRAAIASSRSAATDRFPNGRTPEPADPDPDGFHAPYHDAFDEEAVSDALSAAMNRALTALPEQPERPKKKIIVGPAKKPDAEPSRSRALKSRFLSGRKVVVTAGPTIEPIDAVRFVSNYSSGKMGFALAEAARDAGARVTLITGPVSLDDPEGVHVIKITTAVQMLNAAKNACLSADISIFAAAVADVRPAEASDRKLKKGEDDAALEEVRLTKNPDILATIGSLKTPEQVVIGFAAETDDVLDNARKKLSSKHADMIVANDVGSMRVFGEDDDKAYLVTETKTDDLPVMSKRKLATLIMVKAATMLSRKRSEARKDS